MRRRGGISRRESREAERAVKRILRRFETAAFYHDAAALYDGDRRTFWETFGRLVRRGRIRMVFDAQGDARFLLARRRPGGRLVGWNAVPSVFEED